VAPEVRYPFALVEARVRAATGDAEAARKRLLEIVAEARTAGLELYELEARLALGELESRSSREQDGRARLRTVEQEAKTLGLALLARQAAAGAR
jgi:hypothetical protein